MDLPQQQLKHLRVLTSNVDQLQTRISSQSNGSQQIYVHPYFKSTNNTCRHILHAKTTIYVIHSTFDANPMLRRIGERLTFRLNQRICIENVKPTRKTCAGAGKFQFEEAKISNTWAFRSKLMCVKMRRSPYAVRTIVTSDWALVNLRIIHTSRKQ